MRSTWSWATVSAFVLFVVGMLSGCGGATGLPGGHGATAGAGGGSAGTAGASGIAGGSGGGVDIGQAGAAGAGGQIEPSATLVSVAVTPAVGSAAVGTKLLLHATGTYSDNSTHDVTATAAWKSSNARFASVAGGVVTAIARRKARLGYQNRGLLSCCVASHR